MNEAKKAFQALQAFYAFKSKLLPQFLKRNIRNINSIEAELMRDYERLTKEAKPGWSLDILPL